MGPARSAGSWLLEAKYRTAVATDEPRPCSSEATSASAAPGPVADTCARTGRRAVSTPTPLTALPSDRSEGASTALPPGRTLDVSGNSSDGVAGGGVRE